MINKKMFLILSVITIIISFISPSLARERKVYVDAREFARAKVEKIERHTSGRDLSSQAEVRVHLKIIDGAKKGQTHTAVYRGEDDMPKGMFYREGDTVFIGISRADGADAVEYISIYDVDNTVGIIILAVLLLTAIILVGRLRGALSMLSLIVTIILLFKLLIPLTLTGHSPLPIAVAISLYAIFITIPIILGFKKKTIAALGATVNTLLFAYVGSALPMVLLIAMRMEPGTPFWLVFNYNPVLSELVKSAIGSIGMFLSMPATAFLCIEMHKRKRGRERAAG